MSWEILYTKGLQVYGTTKLYDKSMYSIKSYYYGGTVTDINIDMVDSVDGVFLPAIDFMTEKNN